MKLLLKQLSEILDLKYSIHSNLSNPNFFIKLYGAYSHKMHIFFHVLALSQNKLPNSLKNSMLANSRLKQI